MKKKWFESWFDTDYYHLLYKHRDDLEAKFFIEKIMQRHHISKYAKVLDLACGKGRHAVVLAQHTGNVLGVDLSENSIRSAQELYKDIQNVDFAVHDMRHVIAVNYFDAVFNLFTSFGYFDRHSDNQKVINAVATTLKPEGIFVLDYINIQYAQDNLIPYDEKIINGKLFIQKRYIENGFIKKEITVEDEDVVHTYEESVQLLSQDYFRQAASRSGLEIVSEYGDYSLERFDNHSSKRYILIAKKKHAG
jgi:2-polyprenyl-3-methyl-5-hydroxy-6-metoxy-1,4-benzoquinol methylase